MTGTWRRNWSSRADQLTGGDAIILSIPKSGRTWVRTFLCAYFCKHEGVPMTLEPQRAGQTIIPRITYSHDLFEQHTKAERWWDRVRGKYLVPRASFRTARIILLARDPRDAFVSHYIQLTRRTPETPEEIKRLTPGEMLRDPRFGIRSIVRVMNSWLGEFAGRPNFSLVRYESLRGNPEPSFRELLAALGEMSPDREAFRHALEFSSFGNMRNLEAAGAFDSKILRAGDVSDPESFKVRRGKVGGFEDYLTAAEQAFASDALRELDARFGYQV